MSKYRQDIPGDRGPLAQLRSPQALDEKILAYARERAPEKQHSWMPRWNNGWATGLVTASIVAVAVLITDTQQPAPIYRDARENATLEHEQHDGEGVVIPAPLTAPAPAAANVTTEPAPHRKAAQQELRAKKIAPGDSGVMTQEEFADMVIAADTVAAPAALKETSKRAPMDDQELHALRTHFSQLLQQGHEVEARDAYRALRLECPGCELPATLALWLAASPQDSAH